MGSMRSASTLTIPSRDSTRVSVPFTMLARRLLVVVTRKFCPTGPSKLPCTWQWRRLQRLRTEDKPPVERRIYGFGAVEGLGTMSVRTRNVTMGVNGFIVETPKGFSQK